VREMVKYDLQFDDYGGDGVVPEGKFRSGPQP
jgi:GDPmannose 4,6-dehydratase